MARLRFTMRAYLFEGHPPDVVLEMCSRQFDIEADGHFATVLVGIGDLDSRQITIANAGHLNPLIISAGDTRYFETEVGLPLGVAPSTYVSQSLCMTPGSTLLCYTDGLVERRGESIDAGLDRLARTAAQPEATVEQLVTRIVSELTFDGPEDDLAILAIKWLEADA
jgi:serine phosphatase RsbU (regulator of sigma subunit)